MSARDVLNKVELPPPAPTLPTYGIPIAHPKAAKPLQKIISKMFRMKHPRPHSHKLKRKEKFY